MSALQAALTNLTPSTLVGRPHLSLVDIVDTKINSAVTGDSEECLPRPSGIAKDAIMSVIAEVRPGWLVGSPDAVCFYGEIHVVWKVGAKQLVLMGFSNESRPALLHHYERMADGTSEHDIEQASSFELSRWLRWLNGQ